MISCYGNKKSFMKTRLVPIKEKSVTFPLLDRIEKETRFLSSVSEKYQFTSNKLGWVVKQVEATFIYSTRYEKWSLPLNFSLVFTLIWSGPYPPPACPNTPRTVQTATCYERRLIKSFPILLRIRLSKRRNYGDDFLRDFLLVYLQYNLFTVSIVRQEYVYELVKCLRLCQKIEPFSVPLQVLTYSW